MRAGRRTTIQPLAFDIYCRVIDNLGDAGVCWRLARQLAREHDAPVTLRIDAPATLAAIAPGTSPGAGRDGVAVEAWEDARPPGRPRTVVVSAFGCALPPEVRHALTVTPQLLWVNLEYLSAEAWIDGCHGLASRKPDDGAVEHFFYPGFSAASGGLLREQGLLAERDAFRADDGAARWLAQRGFAVRPDERRISLFCYPDAPVAELLPLLAAGQRPTHLLVPEGVAGPQLEAFLDGPLAPGQCRQRGALRIERFALLPQEDYDRLLWSCAPNFVRGEDSWLRALWSGAPFVWQPYRQPDDAHRVKLDAFLARLARAARAPREAGAAPRPAATDANTPCAVAADAEPAAEAAGAAAALMRAWDRGAGLAAAWRAYASAQPAVARMHEAFASTLAGEPDLAARLVAFCESRLRLPG